MEDNNCPSKSRDELINRLVASCDSALARGLSPTTIHHTLRQRSSLLKPPPQSSFLPSFSQVLFITFITTLILILVGVVLVNLPEFIPLLLPVSLQSQRCLLPSHPLLMEMVRPIQDNCDFCTTHKGLLELTQPPTKAWFEGVAYKKIPIIVRRNLSSAPHPPPPLDLATLKSILESEPDFWNDEGDDECQFLPFRSPFTSLKHAIQSFYNSTTTPTPDQPSWYIGWSNCHPGIQEKLRSLIPRPSFLPEESSSSGSAIDWIFLGWPGRGAAMHIDYVRRPSWQLQLWGVKRWELRPPPECEDKCPDSINFTIYPGDLLFLETNLWYHETFVEGGEEEGGMSISLGSEYD